VSGIDRRAVRLILALCEMELGDFAQCLGYERGYVSNVLTGQTRPSPSAELSATPSRNLFSASAAPWVGCCRRRRSWSWFAGVLAMPEGCIYWVPADHQGGVLRKYCRSVGAGSLARGRCGGRCELP
jgi:hypothetical protein